MCLAVPAKVLELNDGMARIALGGVERTVSGLLVPDLAVGDYVITHAGFALHKVDEQEAMASLELMRQLAASQVHSESGE
ncbi:MAG: HypC/HybG/HupF family hydrogenase formation chaperone [Deltaproteobacteria bacterium]|nr:HypC/HybG/HupF family hydrogenase formation chaperone [Deltaproteobacteria bacterium]